MEFRLLGPVEVTRDGKPVVLGGQRERFVLGLLLLEAGRLVGFDRVIDALWAEPPPTARAQLHNLVSRLRGRLAEHGAPRLIATATTGYQLDLTGHELDVARFRRLAAAAADGDPEAAARALAEALALWRGDALADIDDELATDVRERLRSEWRAAVEALVEAHIRLQRFDDAVAGIDLLLNDQPYHERLYRQKMAALVGGGRRADALLTYQVAYRRLVDDLGIEPGADLQAMHNRVLQPDEPDAASADEPARAAPPTARELPRTSGVLTGREKILDEVVSELGADERLVSPVALLVGQGGIGKTSIAVAAAHRVAAQFSDGQLYADLRGSHDDPADAQGVLARFLRALGGATIRVPEEPEERLALYRSRLARRRVLVVLDDARDERQLRPLLPGDPGCAAVVTSRRQLGGLVDAGRWSVPLLSTTEAESLLERVVGAERVAGEPEAARAIVELCGHLPLAVCVAAARLGARADWSLEHYRGRLAMERGRLDELAVGDLDVRASIGLSYRALEPEPQHLLRRLGRLGLSDWPAWVVEALVGSEVDADRQLSRLIDMHLVEVHGRDEAGQSRFGLHDLIGDFAREQAALADSGGDFGGEFGEHHDAALPRLVDGWLGLAAVADELVGHGMSSAAGLAHPPAPAAALPTVTAHPRAWFDVERANLQHAVRLAAERRWVERAGGLALRQAGFLHLRGLYDERNRVLRTALECARTTGESPDLTLRLLNALIATMLQQEATTDLTGLATELVAMAHEHGDPVWRLRAATIGCAVALRAGHLDEAVARAAEAVAMTEGSAPRVRGKALESLAAAHLQSGRAADALPYAEESVRAQRVDGDPRILAMRLHTLGDALANLGRFDEAESVLTEAIECSHRVDDELWAANVGRTLSLVERHHRRWGRVAQLLDHTLAVHERHGQRIGVAEGLVSLGEAAIERERFDDAVAPLRRARTLWQRLGFPHEVARSALRLERALRATGDHDAADRARAQWQRIQRELGLSDASIGIRWAPPRW